MTREITGFSNPLVKRVRSLREKKHRRAEGLFLAEGLRILTEAHDVGILPEMLWFAPDNAAHPLIEQLAWATEAAGGEVLMAPPEILARMSGKDNPGVALGVYREPREAIAGLDRGEAPIWFVAQALRDPGNLGTLLRTGDAIGAGGLILIDQCTDPYSVEAVRASMGAIFTQRVVQAEWGDFMRWLRAGAGDLVALSLRASHDYKAAAYASPSFILIGNEARGLPPEYEALCDQLVRIPMLGRADSLNAAVAGAVMGYEILDQLRGPERRAPRL